MILKSTTLLKKYRILQKKENKNKNKNWPKINKKLSDDQKLNNKEINIPCMYDIQIKKKSFEKSDISIFSKGPINAYIKNEKPSIINFNAINEVNSKNILPKNLSYY